MSGATPPEMDDFSQLLLNQAKGQRERTGSTGSGSYYAYAEPEQLHSRGSTSSLRQNSQRQSSGESNNPLHQDSFSLNNPPTIFATSPMPTPASIDYNQSYQYDTYQSQNDYGNSQQSQSNPEQFWTNYIQDDGQQQQQQYPQQLQQNDQQYNQQSYPQYDPSGSNNVASTSYNPIWSEQFVQQQQQQQENGGYGQQVDMGNGAWNGMNGMSGATSSNDNSFQDDLAEMCVDPLLPRPSCSCITSRLS
jgi:hypothetical protein